VETFAGDKLRSDLQQVQAGKETFWKRQPGLEVLSPLLEKAVVANAPRWSGARNSHRDDRGLCQDRVQFASLSAASRLCSTTRQHVSDLDSSRLMTYEAAWRIREGLPCTMESP